MSDGFSISTLPPARSDTYALVSQSVTDTDFILFQRLLERETGIYLSQAKKSLLVGRLSRRLRELGLSSLHKYYKRVLADPSEHKRMIDCISTNETQFFREPLHFDFLVERLLPQWAAQAEAGGRSRTVRVWSAGCSTGEEPASIAMTLLHHLPPASGWQIEILATDISTRVLERARSATWPMERARQIPTAFLRAFMLKGTGSQQGKMKAGPDIRRVICFVRLNLLAEEPPAHSALFDAIFCRNVLIYFQPETKARVVRRLLAHLAPAGYLFVGHSESLNHLSDCLRSVVPTVYVHAQAPVR